MTDIPGFVPLSSYDDESRSKQSGHSPEWKLLRDAISEGEVDGFQHGGSKRWLVNKVQADRLLAERRSIRSIRTVVINGNRKASGEDKATIECLQNIEETLAAILDLLRKQAEADDRPQWHPEGLPG